MLEEALAYARKGWKIFPVAEGALRKQPPLSLDT